MATLNNLIVTRKCYSRLLIKSYKKRFIKICTKISSLIGIEFDSEYLYGDSDNHIEIKIKSYVDKVNPSFQG